MSNSILEELCNIKNKVNECVGFINGIGSNKNVRYYKNVESMKRDISITEDTSCITQGYYEPNDGGGADYIKKNGGFELVVKNGVVNIKQLGAKGDGIFDNSTILKNAVTNYNNILIPDGIYAIKTPLNQPLINLNKNGFTISSTKKGIIKNLSKNKSKTGLETFITISNSQDFKINLNYVGDDTIPNIQKANTGDSCLFINNSSEFMVDLNVSNVRYGVRLGNYRNKSNICENFTLNGKGEKLGYLFALYGCNSFKIDSVCRGVDRSIYLGGCTEGEINNAYTTPYNADMNIILTTEYCNGTIKGCSNLNIKVEDLESKRESVESSSVGISPQKAGFTEYNTSDFENIYMDIIKKSEFSCIFKITNNSEQATATYNNIICKFKDYRKDLSGINVVSKFLDDPNMLNKNNMVVFKNSESKHYLKILGKNANVILDNVQTNLSFKTPLLNSNIILKNGSIGKEAILAGYNEVQCYDNSFIATNPPSKNITNGFNVNNYRWNTNTSNNFPITQEVANSKKLIMFNPSLLDKRNYLIKITRGGIKSTDYDITVTNQPIIVDLVDMKSASRIDIEDKQGQTLTGYTHISLY